ncbi:MAG TPA: choice-of-anchor Q domain-containing protein, partial [Jatrophihabitantaceae bacterium]
TISGNNLTGDNAAGAGLYIEEDSHVTITQSTIAGNTAPGAGSQGGGIYAYQSGVTIRFATISKNSASDGGGIYSYWDGSCGCGAGVKADDTALVNNTGGSGTNNCDDSAGRIDSGGHNGVSDASCAFTTAGDKQNIAAELGALGDSGGQTDTMLPGAGSALIDAGSASAWGSISANVADADQRGTTRPQGSAVDIGAAEAVAPPAATTLTASVASASIDAGESTKVTGTLTDTHGAVSGVPLKLQSRVGTSGAFQAVSTAQTSSLGKATATVSPSASTQYRWKFAGNAADAAVASQPVLITVAQVVSAAAVAAQVVRDHKITIYGTVTPNEQGQTVQLQRYTGGKWKDAGATATVHSQVLPGQHKTTLGYVLHITEAQAGTYKFRVYRAATAKNAPGHSATVTITVTKS